MISPYILRRATTVAKVDHIQYFLRDYFHVCQRQLPADKRSTLMGCDLIWDFENNTCFPLFLRRGVGFCDVTTDPLVPAKKDSFNNANFLTDEEDRRYLLRLERHLDPLIRYEEESLTKSVLRSMRGWYQLNDVSQSNDCAAIRVEHNGFYGIIDPQGNVLVPAFYKSIVPLSLRMREISLFVCYKGDKYTNTVDVYDINGNQIYEDIGGLYLHTEQVKCDFSPEDGNRPAARFAEKLRVIQYTCPPLGDTPPPYKEYVREVDNMRLLPCADTDGGPARIARFSDAVRFARNTEDVDLRDIHDVLYPLAKTVGAFYGQSAKEIMLSIPLWHFARGTSRRLDWATTDYPVNLMLDITEACRTVLETRGLHTAGDIANADLSDVCIPDPSVEAEVFMLQAQLQYTFTHPAQADEEE